MIKVMMYRYTLKYMTNKDGNKCLIVFMVKTMKLCVSFPAYLDWLQSTTYQIEQKKKLNNFYSFISRESIVYLQTKNNMNHSNKD